MLPTMLLVPCVGYSLFHTFSVVRLWHTCAGTCILWVDWCRFCTAGTHPAHWSLSLGTGWTIAGRLDQYSISRGNAKYIECEQRFLLVTYFLTFVLWCFRYRVLAFDHDLLSFADLTFDEWPAVIITNPKEALYMKPGVEPLERIRSSTHIRCFLCVCVFFTLHISPWLDLIHPHTNTHTHGLLYHSMFKPLNSLQQYNLIINTKMDVL